MIGDIGKVLFVDDCLMTLAVHEAALEGRIGIRTAPNGRDALAWIERDPAIAVVVSDMHMPGMNGVELLVEIRRRWPAITRVLLTGSPDRDTELSAMMLAQAFRFLTKPIPVDRLAAEVEAALKHHRAGAAPPRGRPARCDSGLSPRQRRFG